MNSRNLIAFCLLIFLSACKQDSANTASTPTTNEISSFQKAMEQLKSEPGKASAENFILQARKELLSVTDEAKEMDLLLKGLKVAEEYKMGPTAIGFLMPLVKDFPDNPQHEEHFAKLASALHDIGKSIPGGILVNTYETNFPSGKYLKMLKGKQKEEIKDLDAYIKELAANVFIDPDKYGINKISAQKYVDACEAYAIGLPKSEMSPEYLYRAGEMARTLNTYNKALSIFDWIIDKYPNYDKTPTTIFLKGFMLENELKNKEAAKVVYNEFLAKFPKNDLADDVSFLLENIDKTNEELRDMIDKKSKK
jgi:tetratricopeptide (TPR) repeat protein